MSMSSSSQAAAAASPPEPAPSPPPCRVAVAQMTSAGDQGANFETCRRLAEEARARGARMLFLPECFSFIGATQQEVRVAVCGARDGAEEINATRGGHSGAARKLAHIPHPHLIPSATQTHAHVSQPRQQSLARAEPLDGATMARYRRLAADTGLWLSLGGFQETGPDPEHL